MRSETSAILEQLNAGAGGDLQHARSLPPAIYHDAGIHELELERLFGREWICLGRTAEIPDPGDYISRDIAGASVVAIRQRDESLKVFANVCLHRAARLLDGEGHIARISCPYHSWTYELDGQLIGAPFMNEGRDFDCGDYRLRELRSEVWQGFIYVSLDPDAAPLAPGLADLDELIGDYRIADYQPIHVADECWDTNWKCLVENYMDAYHIHRVHRDSFGKYGSLEGQTHFFEGNDACTYHYVDEDPHMVAAHPDNTWISDANRHRTWLINIFPAHTMQLQPDMLWTLSILPQGIGRVRVRWSVSLPTEVLAAATDRGACVDEVMSLIHQVNGEDRPIVENVFQASRTPGAARGPLSHLETNVRQFGRYLARKICDQGDSA